MPPRRQISAADKLSIVKQHLVDKVPISDLADRHQIQPSQVYSWQKQLFDQGATVLANLRRGPRPMDDNHQRIAALETKLARKDGLLAELLEQLGRLLLERSAPDSYDTARRGSHAKLRL